MVDTWGDSLWQRRALKSWTLTSSMLKARALVYKITVGAQAQSHSIEGIANNSLSVMRSRYLSTAKAPRLWTWSRVGLSPATWKAVNQCSRWANSHNLARFSRLKISLIRLSYAYSRLSQQTNQEAILPPARTPPKDVWKLTFYTLKQDLQASNKIIIPSWLKICSLCS